MSLRRLLAAAAVAALAITSACSSGDPGGTTSGAASNGTSPSAVQLSGSITFWTPHLTPPRLAKQQEIAKKFEAKTGVKVEVVGLGAADQNQALVTGAASGKVPDVVMVAPDQIAAWGSQGLLDLEAPQQVVNSLGADTFAQQALQLAQIDGKLGGVPSDGWAHLLVYRKDLLTAAGIQPPKTIEDVAAAATKLKSGTVSGMAIGTRAGTPSATEALESVLQPAGCKLVTDGKVTIDSSECVKGLQLFKQMNDSSVAGQMDVTAARTAYLAGNAGMLLFSSHILDELAGLDPANPVSCAQCTADKQWLAKNSGFVTVLQTADGKGAQYGTTLNYVIPTNARTNEAKAFIDYMLNEGYVDNLSTATEGRVPLRAGTKDAPTKFTDAWAKLPFGVDQSGGKSISDVYGADIASSVQKGAMNINRWGFGTKDAALAGKAFSQHILSKNVEPLLTGTPADQVAKNMAAAVKALQ